ncbi:MAG: hypothetical protein HYZ85_00950 [Candidatus Omnitrophica bacterium]|nr:hypothetical protein [Candidatus Omnitrophota bacterium]
MRILFIIDPLERLDFNWDSSLFLMAEMRQRRHKCWAADPSGIWTEQNRIWLSARDDFKISSSKKWALRDFDLVLLRKEPPFDEHYTTLTHLLELEAHCVPFVNHPAGIRNTGEKLSCLLFPRWIPETLVSSSAEEILQFYRQLKYAMVLKPLHLKGGKGVLLIQNKEKKFKRRIQKSTLDGKQMIMAQRFVPLPKGQHEKRIVLLNGNPLWAYEKRPVSGEFRANLGLGAKFFPSQISQVEKELARDLKPYLLRQGLYFVGLDVRAGKLLEINVTCPAGIVEATILYPKLRPVEVWANWLEDFARSFSKRRPPA